jgi:transaldolase
VISPDKHLIKLYVDAADVKSAISLKSNPLVKGFTTNPTLMRAAGVADYLTFAKLMVAAAHPYPVSLEVIADDFKEMHRQALILHNLGENVFVKIPVTNTKGEGSFGLINELAQEGVPQNVTAVMSSEQIEESISALAEGPTSVLSIFAGRIADTGVNPTPIVAEAVFRSKGLPIEILWASPRQIYNLVEAESANCHIITLTPDLWKKLPLIGKDLNSYSLETVEMFYRDARTSGYKL